MQALFYMDETSDSGFFFCEGGGRGGCLGKGERLNVRKGGGGWKTVRIDIARKGIFCC